MNRITTNLQKEIIIKTNTETLVDGYLRECVRERDPNLAANAAADILPTDLNRLCIKFIYLKLKGIGQTIMWRIFNGTLSEWISSGGFKLAFSYDSERRVEIAQHCIANQIIAPLKVIVEYIYQDGFDNDCLIPLTICAIKNRSFGGLSVLLQKCDCTDKNAIIRAAVYLCNTVRYQYGNQQLMLYIMEKIGMYESVETCRNIALELIKKNMTNALIIIADEYSNYLPKAHMDAMRNILENNAPDYKHYKKKKSPEPVFMDEEYNDWEVNSDSDNMEWEENEVV
eukprot:516880_1